MLIAQRSLKGPLRGPRCPLQMSSSSSSTRPNTGQMPARLRLPLALLVCALATAGLSTDSLARREGRRPRPGARAHPRHRLRRWNSAPEPPFSPCRASARPTTPRRRSGRQAFSTFARVPLARPEIAAVGWVPLVAAAQRGEVEQTEQIRIEAPAGTPFTYPLVRQEPAATSLDVLDLGSDPSLVEALRTARDDRSAPALGSRSVCPATAASASTPSSPSSRRACRSARPLSAAAPSRGSSQVPSSRASWSAPR